VGIPQSESFHVPCNPLPNVVDVKARQTEQAYYTRPSPIYKYELATPFIYPYITISQHFNSSAAISKEPKKEFCLFDPSFQVNFSPLILISSEFNTFTSWVFFKCLCMLCLHGILVMFWSKGQNFDHVPENSR